MAEDYNTTHTECVRSVCFIKWDDLSALLPPSSYLGIAAHSQHFKMSQDLSFEGARSSLGAVVGRLAISKFMFKHKGK